MKMERLSQDKIRIFLTFDDLSERGIQKEDMWREIPKVHELFSEMMDQAYNELGFDTSGPLAVEVFTLPSQGMVVIVTRGKINEMDLDSDELQEEIYELEVTLERSESITFSFDDFEPLLGAVYRIKDFNVEHCSLYSYKGQWVLQIDSIDLEDQEYDSVVALLSEYGQAVTLHKVYLQEYAKLVISDNAIEVLLQHFNS